MTYELRWQQPRDGAIVPQTHTFEDLDEAKEFAQGLGADAHAEIFEQKTDRPEDAEKPVWSADTPQATEKERSAARAAATVGKAEGVGPNTQPDTREDAAQDLKDVMGNKPQTAAPAPPQSQPAGASPANSRQLDAGKK